MPGDDRRHDHGRGWLLKRFEFARVTPRIERLIQIAISDRLLVQLSWQLCPGGDFQMSDLRMVTATIAAGPNAGCTATFLAALGATEELTHLNRAARRQVKAAGIREIREATHCTFMSDEFLDALTGAAALVFDGLFDTTDLAAANIATLCVEEPEAQPTH
jgi:hypothetical protein